MRRSPCATLQLNPELSIVTTASGRCARIAATARRTWRRITGARGNTSAIPATARSASGTRLSIPCSRMRSPPIPAIRSPGPTRSRSAAINPAPSASPEGSPVMMKMNGASTLTGTGSRRPHADDKQPGPVGGADDLVALEQQGRAGLDRDALQPGLGGERHRLRADRRPVDAALLPRFL